ncbi:HD-GYP domain-containing protein [Brevibacillus daliensis]|uniref:HD-GYP domain-containing protein n=1 Tax=Brevibacillus daliensis TaxID=2892995 RepID=UPI001E5E3214|nr:HD-GYP domain-containing protein [Brevibacillus daliensis]
MAQVYLDYTLEGKVLAEDVFNNFGVLLLSKGSVLTTRDIIKLKSSGLRYVGIVDKMPSGNESMMKEQWERISADKKLVANYMEATGMLRDMYDTVSSQNKIPTVEACVEVYEKVCLKEVGCKELLRSLYLIEGSDHYTYRHSINVSMLSSTIATLLGLPDEEVEIIGLAGLMHDIGKMKIPAEIIHKPGKLTDEEFEIMKLHTVYGYDLIKRAGSFPEIVRDVALLHHERLDGGGYPEKRKGDAIPLPSQIVAVADMYDAICSDRIYRERTSPFEAAKILWDDACSGKLSPKIVGTFIYSIVSMYVGSKALLSNGEKVEVVMIHQDEPMRPFVKKDDGTCIDLRLVRNLNLQKLISEKNHAEV